jgi:hypothetical protein
MLYRFCKNSPDISKEAVQEIHSKKIQKDFTEVIYTVICSQASNAKY